MTRASEGRDLIPDLALADVLRQRPLGLGSLRHIIRVTLAVAVSFVVATMVSQSTLGIFAPITTLMVVQASPWSTVGVSVQRILGTGIGVLVASLWVNLVGLTWWSFLLGVLASLLVARALPWSLGGQLQIPVAVIFVLAIGPGSLSADLWRVVDVVLGGIIGLAAVFIYPPRPRPERVEAALEAYRDGIVDTLSRVGRESGVSPSPLPADAPHDYVSVSRGLRDRADDARSELTALVESTHWNLRASRARAQLDGQAARLRRLSGLGIQVRGVVGVANRMYDRDGRPPAVPAPSLAVLITRVVELMGVVLGTAGDPVAGTDAGLAARLDDELARDLLTTAGQLQSSGATSHDVLAALSLVGRLDHIRVQLSEFPGWADDRHPLDEQREADSVDEDEA